MFQVLYSACFKTLLLLLHGMPITSGAQRGFKCAECRLTQLKKFVEINLKIISRKFKNVHFLNVFYSVFVYKEKENDLQLRVFISYV